MLKSVRSFFADIKTDLFHSSLLISGSLLAQVISVVAYPVLTRLYSPVEYGSFSVFLGITGILAVVATGRFDYALMTPEKDNEAMELKQTGLWWCTVFSFSCLAVSVVLGLFHGISSKIPGLYFIALYVFLTGTTQIFTFYRNRIKQYKKLAQVSVLQNAVSSGSKVVFGLPGLFSHGLIWGSLIGQLVAFVVVSKGFLRWDLFKKPVNLRSIFLRYGAFPKFRMVQALINSVSSNLPIFFITFYFSAKEAGYFALVAGIAYKIVSLISSSLYQVLFRRFAEQKNTRQPIMPLFGKMLLLLAATSILPGLLIFFLADYFISLFFGAAWMGAVIYLKMMLPWLIMVFIATPFAFMADVFSLQKKVLVIDMVLLFLRILGLSIGFWYHNVYTSVFLYALVSIVFLLFIIIWYFYIIKKEHDQKILFST